MNLNQSQILYQKGYQKMYYYLLVTSISCMHGYIRYNVWIYTNEAGKIYGSLFVFFFFYRILTLDPYPEGKRKEEKERKKKINATAPVTYMQRAETIHTQPQWHDPTYSHIFNFRQFSTLPSRKRFPARHANMTLENEDSTLRVKH